MFRTKNVSSSVSASSLVEIVPVPLVEPEPIVMLDSEPSVPSSPVPASGGRAALVSVLPGPGSCLI